MPTRAGMAVKCVSQVIFYKERVMANSLANIMPKILARGLLALRERAVMPRLVNGDYSAQAAEKGDTIDVPIPTAVSVIDVAPSNTPPAGVDTTPSKVQVTLNNWKQSQPFFLSDKDMVEVDANAHFVPMQVSEAVKALANEVNTSIHNTYKGVYGYVGTAGTTPFGTNVGVLSATDVRKVLNKQLCPRNDRRGVLDFDAEAMMLSLAQFSDAEKVGSADVKIEGEIGRKFGIDWYADDAVVTHTAGTITGALTIKTWTANGAVGATSVIATTAASTGACDLKEGDIIVFSNQTTNTYVVSADAAEASAETDVTITFQPPLKAALVQGTTTIAVKASHKVNLAFHRDAIAFATRPLVSSTQGYELGSRILSMQDPQTGLVLRLEVSRQHKRTAWEFDILWGVKLVRAALAARIAG